MRFTISLLVLIMIFTASLLAVEVPNIINFQGYLTNGSTPLDGSFELTFKIYDVPTGGTELWTETRTFDVSDGYYSILLGEVTPIDISFSGNAWIGVQITGQSEMTPRYQIASMPYAYVAKHADSISNNTVDSTKVIDGSLSIFDLHGGSAAPGQTLKWTGAEWAPADDALGGGGPGEGWADDGDVVRLTTSTDSVGIGTAYPRANLEVIGTIMATKEIMVGTNHAISAGYSSVTGGDSNTVAAAHSHIGGGEGNRINGTHSFIGGGGRDTTFGIVATICGGTYNSTTASSGGYSTIVGGTLNRAEDAYDFIGGGEGNTAGGHYSTIGGGYHNLTDSSYSFVGGGYGDTAYGDYSSIVGGISNQTDDQMAFIGGGGYNHAEGIASAIAGGERCAVFGNYGFIGGGYQDTVLGSNSNIGGGVNNVVTIASEGYSVIGGGGGNRNEAAYSTIGGGYSNLTGGVSSTIPGGDDNSATGDYSFAAGKSAWAFHKSTFVWNGDTTGSFISTDTGQFLINAPGGVGIGTATIEASHLLHVNGLAKFEVGGGSIALSTPGGWPGIISYSTGGDRRDIIYNNDGMHIIASTSSSAPALTEGITILDGGNVGVKTAIPATDFDVNGDIRCVSLTQTSDIRFKKNISPINNALNNIMQIDGVKYDWKNKLSSDRKFSDKRQIGLVAQDVEEIYPELVDTDNQGYKSVSYSKMTAVLLEAIKELKKENDELKSRMENLEKNK
ncbi:MAG: hypothetical protein GY865_02570 [candidate division Zixibacteria bacterium]|nr:hypothetical protein [candidate division Zixibacteria bacterium]